MLTSIVLTEAPDCSKETMGLRRESAWRRRKTQIIETTRGQSGSRRAGFYTTAALPDALKSCPNGTASMADYRPRN